MLIYIFLQDKILQSTGRGNSVTVTNDGATILKSLHIDNPAAKVLVGILQPVVLVNVIVLNTGICLHTVYYFIMVLIEMPENY